MTEQTRITELDRELLAPSQAARALGISVETIRQLRERGRLPAIQTPLGRLYRRGDIERIARERAAAHGANREDR